MRVSSRYACMVSTVVGCLMAASAAANATQASPTPPSPPPTYNSGGSSCCTHPGGPMIQPPNVYVGAPNVYVGGPNIHMGGGGMGGGGTNVNVNVNLSANLNATATATASALATASAMGSSMSGSMSGAGAGAGGSTIIYTGGSYVRGGGGPAPTALTGLRVAGQTRVEYVEEERTRWLEEWRVVRAVCVDDTGTPHPASRPDPEDRVSPDYDGEIFRCMAGTSMHVTIGWRENGHDRFDGGDTITCRKGEALRHGRGGNLHCASEEARRNCNERSLLRMHGPGIKLVYRRYEERYTERVEREVEVSENTSMTLMLNGGVGGYW